MLALSIGAWPSGLGRWHGVPETSWVQIPPPRIMELVRVPCAYCKKSFLRSVGRFREARKMSWRQYCSPHCQFASRQQRVEVVYLNPTCQKPIRRLFNQFKHSKRAFCSKRCAAIVNNVQFPKRIPETRACKHCQAPFSRSRSLFCSKVCKREARKLSQATVVEQIRGFHKQKGRIPLKMEFPHYSAARRRFGTWNKAVRAAGFETNPVLFAKKFIARDGHRCDSFTEKIIDDWLSANHVTHKRNIPYPDDSSLTADFKIGNGLVEFFGLAGQVPGYDLLIERKRKLCRKYGVDLIELLPRDIYPHNSLAEKFASFLRVPLNLA